MTRTSAMLLVLAGLGATACATPPPPPAPPTRASPAPTRPPPPRRRPFVSVGYLHWCTLAADGRVSCQGGNAIDQLRVPSTRLVTLSAGMYHSCGLTPEGRPVCWGSDRGPYRGYATANLPPPPDVKLTAISAGDHYTCGLDRNAHVVCWGSAGWAREPTPEGAFVAVTAGSDHACALRASGEVVCFGEESGGKIPCTDMEEVPPGRCRAGESLPKGWTPPPKGLVASAVAAGASHTCAVTRAATVVCWGADGNGGSTLWAGQTRVPEGLTDVVAVTAGGGHSCALTRSGKVACWGDVSSPAGRFVQLSSGAHQACGVRRDGAVVCSGELVLKKGGLVFSFQDDPRWTTDPEKPSPAASPAR